jgi:hypothetical protein
VETLYLKNLLGHVLDGLIGNKILHSNWRALLLFLLILRLKSWQDSWFVIDSMQFKAKVGITMLLREVIEWQAVILSDGMSKGMVNDVLRDIL